jgi:hypothetical protein
MPNHIQGAFHFHSTYSHDGRSSLAEIASRLHGQGLSFCIMTEHFEDFDEPKFNRYIQETTSVSSSSFLLIPGMEVDVEGLHTIIFPVQQYGEIADLSAFTRLSHNMFKVLAHPSKYPLEKVAAHLDKYSIEGIEVWNQQSDGSYVPPFRVLESLTVRPDLARYRYLFGCDIHNAKLAVRNLISLARPHNLSAQAILDAIRCGEFVSRNITTNIEHRNGSEEVEFNTWVQMLHGRSYGPGRLLSSVRDGLKLTYKMLPRPAQRSLNDVKNIVRSHF